MKELLAIITISFMEAVGFIGFIAGLLGLDLSDMGFERFAALITVVSALVFIFICTYLHIKQDRKRGIDTETEHMQNGHARSYRQIGEKSMKSGYITTYPIDKCRKSTKNDMCA